MNHGEARELAELKKMESNLARCYLDLVQQLEKAQREAERLDDVSYGWATKCDSYLERAKAAELQLSECQKLLQASVPWLHQYAAEHDRADVRAIADRVHAMHERLGGRILEKRVDACVRCGKPKPCPEHFKGL